MSSGQPTKGYSLNPTSLYVLCPMRKCSTVFQLIKQYRSMPSAHQNEESYLSISKKFSQLQAIVTSYTLGQVFKQSRKNWIQVKIILNCWMKALESWRLVARESVHLYLGVTVWFRLALRPSSLFQWQVGSPTFPSTAVINCFLIGTKKFSLLLAMVKYNLTGFIFPYSFVPKASMYPKLSYRFLFLVLGLKVFLI